MGILAPSLTISEFFKKHNDSIQSKKVQALVDDLLSQIKELIPKMDILDVFRRVENSLLTLQKEAFLYGLQQKSLLESTIHKQEAQELKEALKEKSKFSELESLLSEVFEVIYTIQTEKLPLSDEQMELVGSVFSEKLTQKHIDFLSEIMPNFSIDLLIKTARNGLLLDFLMTVSSYVIKGEIQLDVERLRPLLRITLEEYAVNQIHLGTWTPKDDDRRQLVTNIKIRASYYEYNPSKSVA